MRGLQDLFYQGDVWAFPAAPLRSAAGRAFRHSAIAPAASLARHFIPRSVQWPPAGVAPGPNAAKTTGEIREIRQKCI